MSSDKEHPGLKGFSKVWEGVKHIAGKALKWAAVGAVALAAVSVLTGFAPVAALVGTVGGWLGLGNATAAVTTTMVGFMKVGAAAGALMGAVSGVGSLGSALDERQQDAIADYEQAQVARERAALMRGRGQAVSGGVSSGLGLGRSQSQGLGM